jgi:hypothetical protein
MGLAENPLAKSEPECKPDDQSDCNFQHHTSRLDGEGEMGNYQFRAIRGLLVVTVIVLGLIVGLLLAFRVAVPVRTYGPWPFAIQNNPRSLAQMTANMEFSAG